MDLLVVLVLIALIATIGALVAGVVSMGTGGPFDERHATHLMAARLGFQALAFVALLVALAVAAG